MSEPVVLDSAALARLKEWGGEKLLVQMIQLFLDNSPARMEQIRAGAQADGDVKEAEKGAHSLKSSAANVGAEEVRTLAAAVERHASAGAHTSVGELLPQLESAYARARTALEEIDRGNDS
jgi:HPt (histidine-containing phosphotransfer) domain-containing protein